MSKTLLTQPKTTKSEKAKVYQFHIPFHNSLIKTAIITVLLMVCSSIIIPIVYISLAQPHQIATTSLEKPQN